MNLSILSKTIGVLLLIPQLLCAQIITTIGGIGARSCSGENEAATSAGIGQLYGITVDAGGNVFIVSSSCSEIKRINTSGIINTVAGSGSATGDGGPATDANIGMPTSVATDRHNNLFICDMENSVIRKVDATGNIYTIAGNAAIIGGGYGGDGGPATAALLGMPNGIATDTAGNLFIADGNNNIVRKITTDGIINWVAGNGTFSYSGDGGPATSAGIPNPVSVFADNHGDLYVVDDDNSRIRKITPDGNINLFAGNGIRGYSGDGGPATAASLNYPQNVTADRYGNIMIADMDNSVIRKVDTNGIISTFAGIAIAGHSGDGGPANAAQLDQPFGIAKDDIGNLYISELNGAYVRKLDTCIIPATSPISGTTTLCSGETATITDARSGGVWSVSDTAVASISATGFVTAITRGLVAISYTLTNSCASQSVSEIITVGPYAGSIIPQGYFTGVTIDTFCNIGEVASSGSPSGYWLLTDTLTAKFNPPGIIIPLMFMETPDTLMYIDTDSCGSDTAFLSFVIRYCDGGVKPVAANAGNVTVYPNPATSELNISCGISFTELTISDLQGRTIYRKIVNSNQATVDISKLAPGMYFVKTDNVVSRFLKE